jgi:hypothetical protein
MQQQKRTVSLPADLPESAYCVEKIGKTYLRQTVF